MLLITHGLRDYEWAGMEIAEQCTSADCKHAIALNRKIAAMNTASRYAPLANGHASFSAPGVSRPHRITLERLLMERRPKSGRLQQVSVSANQTGHLLRFQDGPGSGL
jgi:hypothetical protein